MKTAEYYFHLQYPISSHYVDRMRSTRDALNIHHELLSNKLEAVWNSTQYDRTYELLATAQRINSKLKAIDHDFETWFAKVYL